MIYLEYLAEKYTIFETLTTASTKSLKVKASRFNRVSVVALMSALLAFVRLLIFPLALALLSFPCDADVDEARDPAPLAILSKEYFLEEL